MTPCTPCPASLLISRCLAIRWGPFCLSKTRLLVILAVAVVLCCVDMLGGSLAGDEKSKFIPLCRTSQPAARSLLR